MKLQASHLISGLLALALVALSLSFTSGTAQASSSYSSYVTSYTLKVRSKASTHYRTLRTLNMGNKVTVTSKYGKYSRIKYGNTTGYVQTQHLSRSKYKSYSAYVTSYTLKVRSKASVHYSTKRTLNMANKVTVLGKGNKYALIKYGSTTGYVQNIHLNKSKFKSLSAYVTSYTLKVRSAASVHYTLQSTLAMGNKVTVLGKGNKYALISYGGKTGYVQNIHLNSQAFRSYNAYVTSNTLKIRDNASVHYTTRLIMAVNNRVTVTGKGNKYAQVKFGNITGYVQAKYLTTTQPAAYGNQPTDPPVTDGSQFGLDISHYQNDAGKGQIDFNAIKQDGNSFIIAKASEGGGTDGTFVGNAVGAHNAGLTVNAYHFFRATDVAGAQNEANVFSNQIRTANAQGAPIHYLFIDVETQNGVDKDTLTNNVIAFLNQMRANGFNQLGIYSNLYFFNTYINLPNIVNSQAGQSKLLIWLSRYRGQETNQGPGANFDVDIWQYTSSGSSSGIIGAVDKNIWYYTVNGL
ncbi:SH3 domain-containing protein [Sporolactobacillus nakayamae]|uniref:Lyzozyme M1 (1,4-beta-N-acetylmuramidase), GH25 family n=1 Tax=Sporolactobacillus nakayamae TaxID=269670 RepID=A0A1I2SRW8_9BACL|nr:GH25 family lysozyme [Sporolactobacillus nakayamae]SFG55303.1 Lyzozyme M1 (1,4-beta-N-acetylmuramidase), GH25 family [Sporolactobacillus nakayamae]